MLEARLQVALRTGNGSLARCKAAVPIVNQDIITDSVGPPPPHSSESATPQRICRLRRPVGRCSGAGGPICRRASIREARGKTAAAPDSELGGAGRLQQCSHEMTH